MIKINAIQQLKTQSYWDTAPVICETNGYLDQMHQK